MNQMQIILICIFVAVLIGFGYDVASFLMLYMWLIVVIDGQSQDRSMNQISFTSRALEGFYSSGRASVWLMLVVSVGVHVALLLTLPEKQAQANTSLGALAAPVSVSVSFAAVQQPAVVQQETPVKPEQEPEPVKPPKPKKIVEESRIVQRPEPKPEPVKQPEPKKEPVEVAEQKPEVVEQKVAQEQQLAAQQTTTVEAENTGVADDMVVVTDPMFRSTPDPLNYPRAAQRRNQQGKVLVEAIVDEQGNTMDLKVLESSGFALLDRAALKWVAELEFMPGSRDGAARLSRVHMPVVFALKGRRG